jgi:hypothetical protein
MPRPGWLIRVLRTIAAAATMNRIGVTGYPGVRNGRGAFGS